MVLMPFPYRVLPRCCFESFAAVNFGAFVFLGCMVFQFWYVHQTPIKGVVSKTVFMLIVVPIFSWDLDHGLPPASVY
jgi:hypothetical protein